MKKKLLNISDVFCTVFGCLLLTYCVFSQNPVYAEISDVDRETALKLIVMIEGEFDEAGDEKTLGGGIIFGRDDDHVYIATANHVVRKGTRQVHSLQVKFRDIPDQAVPAELLENFDVELDLAVLRVKREKSDQKESVGCIQFDRLADPAGLKRGVRVYPVGYPNGIPWAMPVLPDAIAQVTGKEFAFQSAFISAGHSGGGVIYESGELLGLILKDQPPFGGAVKINNVLAQLRKWNYPVDLRTRKYGRKNPVLKAIEEKDVEEAKLLIRDCHNVNVWDEEKKVTPLILAARGNLLELLDALLEAGAEVNVSTSCTTPLSAATYARKPDIRVIRLLLKYGADPAFWGPMVLRSGCAALLDGAVSNSDVNVQILKALLDARTWNNPREKASLQQGLVSAASRRGQVEKIKLLLAAGAEIDALGLRGRAALHKAAEYARDAEAVKFLLDAGAQVDAVAKVRLDSGAIGERTALHLIANRGRSGDYSEIAALLIEAGADVNGQQGDERYTPLHHVFQYGGNEEVAAPLFEACANPYIRDRKGKLPMDYAAEDHLKEIFDVLKERGSLEKNKKCPENVRFKVD